MAVTAFHVEAFRPWIPPRHKQIPRPRPPHAHDHKAQFPLRSNPALPCALYAPAPPHSLDSQPNNQQHPLPARPPAEVCVHENLRPDIRQSACPELSEEPIPASGGPNELSVSELYESPAVFAMRAATSPQAQTQCGSPASGLNRLGDAVTTDITIGSQWSIQGAAGCRSPSENPASSAQQSPGLHEPAVIPIDPAILGEEFPLESNQPHQDIRESGTLWSSQRELPCPYPEPPIAPHSIFDNDHLSPGLIDENRPATHRQCGGRSRQTRPGNNAESNESSRGPRQQHCNSGVNQTEQRKRPSTGSDERKRRRNKRQRIEETSPSLAENSCASLRFHFLSLPTNARLKFLSWLFEGALPRCAFEPEISSNSAPAKRTDGTRVRKQVRWATPQEAADSVDNSNTRERLRKGMPWLPEEEDLLIDLRNTRRLPWSEVIKLLSDQYPGRSPGSIQVHWCTKLKKRRS
ncbi:hypothetical protein BDV59DRAFT_67446 [Aspergillus ambiguus]|uniref:uncharacterized protein n=1 Tax=Aspergillus ambiguus TaxID=176160 RepID=UPI003CCE4BF8